LIYKLNKIFPLFFTGRKLRPPGIGMPLACAICLALTQAIWFSSELLRHRRKPAAHLSCCDVIIRNKRLSFASSVYQGRNSYLKVGVLRQVMGEVSSGVQERRSGREFGKWSWKIVAKYRDKIQRRKRYNKVQYRFYKHDV